ncbi:MAG: hypothetical protein OEV06_03415, partial [Anaerolineae bacterium]|nr:hypothetical protein [Anaerolineae bacterium]
SQLSTAFNTDLSLGDILELAPMAFDLSSARIRSYYIGSDMVTIWRTPIQNAYTMLPDHEKIHEMLLEAFAPPDDLEEANLLTRIEIINQSNHPDWGILAAERLTYAGFDTVVVTPARRTSTPTTLIDLNDERELDQVEFLAGLLFLRMDEILFESSTNSEYSYRLIIGDDFSPCFNPHDLDR